MKAERKKKGEQYYFISRRTLRPVLTRDEYFESDDERYKNENYFISKEAAYSCAGEIQEHFGEKLERIQYNKEQNDRIFIKAIKSLPSLYNLTKAPAATDEKKRGPKTEPKIDDCIFDLLRHIQEHDEKKEELDATYKLVMAAIENIIADADKE